MTTAENPFEVDLVAGSTSTRAILLAAGASDCRDGPARQMKGVILDGAALMKNNEHRWPVYAGDTEVGAMTSAVHSPRLDQNIGLRCCRWNGPNMARALPLRRQKAGEG